MGNLFEPCGKSQKGQLLKGYTVKGEHNEQAKC